MSLASERYVDLERRLQRYDRGGGGGGALPSQTYRPKDSLELFQPSIVCLKRFSGHVHGYRGMNRCQFGHSHTTTAASVSH